MGRATIVQGLMVVSKMINIYSYTIVNTGMNTLKLYCPLECINLINFEIEFAFLKLMKYVLIVTKHSSTK